MGINVRAEAVTFGSIAGGFVRVDVAELAHAWHACRARPLGIGDFRTLLATREMVARREAAGEVHTANYGVAELADLLDVARRTAAASIRRLVNAGLLAWSESAITFPAPPDRGRLDDLLADTIGGGRGTISIPRRLLRYLARAARPALIATALAALLRCVARRKAGYAARGRFKSSWISRVFGVAERHARSARAKLVALGWLEPVADDPQWAWNRWGRSFRVRLDWRGSGDDRPTLPARFGVRSSYPGSDPDPLREKFNPEPAGGGPAGAALRETRTDRPKADHEPKPSHPTTPSPTAPEFHGVRVTVPIATTPIVNQGTAAVAKVIPKPDLRDVRPEDLTDTGRILELHRQAVERGRITASEADRVRFVAAAEHARAVGKANPPGLLARVVAKGWWHLVTQGDEDRAVRRLREHNRPTSIATARNSRPGLPAPAPVLTTRSPYGAERPTRESSALANVLARLAGNHGSGEIA